MNSRRVLPSLAATLRNEKIKLFLDRSKKEEENNYFKTSWLCCDQHRDRSAVTQPWSQAAAQRWHGGEAARPLPPMSPQGGSQSHRCPWGSGAGVRASTIPRLAATAPLCDKDTCQPIPGSV